MSYFLKFPKEHWFRHIDNNGSLFMIPEDELTEEICLYAMKKDIFCFWFLPRKFQTKKICLYAILSDGDNIFRLRPEFGGDKQICELAVQTSKK